MHRQKLAHGSLGGVFNEEVARLRKNFWMSEPIPWFSDLAK